MTDPRPAPYPADTRAKGWRFELEYERIEQSDTWAIAEEVPMAQHALLFMWLAAWKQEPCGSFPNDEAVIRSKCRVPPKLWPALRSVLLRGWWLADDGRLYHPTITARVMEMLEYRRKTAERVAKHKAAKRDERAGNALPTQTPGVKNDTGTGTGTGTNLGDTEDHHHPGGGADAADDGEFDPGPFVGSNQPTAAGVICGALRRAGIHDTNPGHPTLLALLEAGAQQVEFAGFVPAALAKSPKQPFAYLLGAVKGERERAATLTGNLHRGPMPNRQEAIEQRNAAVGDAWLAEQGAA
jgi:hypothetical protein